MTLCIAAFKCPFLCIENTYIITAIAMRIRLSPLLTLPISCLTFYMNFTNGPKVAYDAGVVSGVLFWVSIYTESVAVDASETDYCSHVFKFVEASSVLSFFVAGI